MRVVRCCLLAVSLSPLVFFHLGCSNENVDKGAATGDTSKTFKSSDEAQKAMMNTAPPLTKKH